MMLIYLLAVIFSGYTFALLLLPLRKDLTTRMAIAPLLGVLIPSLCVFALNTISTTINTTSLLWGWIPLATLPLLFGYKQIINEIIMIKSILCSEKKVFKFTCGFISLALIGYLVQGILSEMWTGDGIIHWAPKAQEWANLGKIDYQPFIKKRVAQSLDYPLYHSIGMMINHLMFKNLPSVFTVKIFDSIYVVGIFFSSILLLKRFFNKRTTILITAAILTFSARPLIAMNKAGYAEIELAYYLFLSFILFITWIESNYQRHIIAMAISCGLLCITKNEGMFRLILTALPLLFFYRKQLFNIKEFSLFATPIIILMLINHLNMPSGGEQFYYKNFNIELSEIPQRIIFMGKVFLYHFPNEGILKSSWTLLFVLAPIITIHAKKTSAPYAKVLMVMLIIFYANFLFSFVPNMINTTYNEPYFVAHEIVQRINLQVILFLCAICTVGIFSKINLSFDYQKLQYNLRRR